MSDWCAKMLGDSDKVRTENPEKLWQSRALKKSWVKYYCLKSWIFHYKWWTFIYWRYREFKKNVKTSSHWILKRLWSQHDWGNKSAHKYKSTSSQIGRKKIFCSAPGREGYQMTEEVSLIVNLMIGC